MHALFEAVRSDPAGESGTAGTGNAAGGPSSFAGGLSALTTQMANGSAPSDLQSAFAQLVQDAGTPATSATAGSANASLRAFLTQLQANLGDAASSRSGSGNPVATQA